MAQSELLWALVYDGTVEDMQKLNLQGMDWKACNSIGETILVLAIRAGSVANDKTEARKKVEWLIQHGASITDKCSDKARATTWFKLKDRDDKDKILSVDTAGKSAVSFVLAVREVMKNKPDWELAYIFLGQLWSVFANGSESHPRVSIHESIVDLWEKAFLAKASHDVAIQTADGEVTAHAHMLKEASVVISAMLELPMKEGRAQRIEVKDASSSAVSLFLQILYTCSAHDDVDWQTALQSLDLAHRWQVHGVVAILTDLLSGMITDQNFARIAEHAILKDLDRLKAAAQSFAAGSTAIQGKLKKGRGKGNALPEVVAEFLGSKAPQKRKRHQL